MRFRFLERLGVLLAALTLAVFGAVTPASAAALHGCPDDYVCLYQWINYGAPAGDANPGWKSSFYNLYAHTNNCINLTSPAAYWPNGTQVWDNSAGLVVNNATWPSTWYISIYNWANCNSGGGIASTATLGADTTWPNLNDVPIGGGLTAYQTTTSIRITYGSCPPGGC